LAETGITTFSNKENDRQRQRHSTSILQDFSNVYHQFSHLLHIHTLSLILQLTIQQV